MRLFIMFWLALLTAQSAPAGAALGQYAPARSDPEEQVPAKLDSEGEAVVHGMNRFGFELYAKVRGERGSIALSPASISTAFGLAYAGARGSTAEEIASVLHYPSITDVHHSVGTLLRTMDLHQNGRTLTVNNSLWVQPGLNVQPAYAAVAAHDYAAGLQQVDFRADPDSARKTINRWIESKTDHRIRNLLSPPDVTPDTRSVLVSTIYFKADWEVPFDKSDTRSEPFTLASGRKAQRPLMHREGDYSFAEWRGVKALAMPYRGGETEMVAFLPDKANGLAKLERSLDSASVEQWLARLEQSQSAVVLTFPKFRIEKRFQLAPVLEAMGMRMPFSSEADFAGIAVNRNLNIGSVVHQVFVEVEEKGTEAAAATGTGIIVSGARIPLHPTVFRADHPFLFLIRDRGTGAILFIGRYTGESA